jgi:molecular chaperone Hsp33
MDINEIKKSLQLRDRSVRIISKNGHFRAVCLKNTLTAQTAQSNHNLEGIAAVLLAKTLSAASMAASYLKGEERITLEADGNGPISKIFAEAIQLGEVRGYVDFKNPDREVNVDKIEDVIGLGLFRLSRVLYNKSEPITGVIPLQKGDIETDLAYYYTHSEQIPSAVILDCDLDDNGKITQSGGLILQAMPGYEETEIREVFESIKKISSITELFDRGLNPQQVLSEILPFEFDVLNSTQVDFFCRCSKDNFMTKLLTLGKYEIDDMQKSGQNEIVCKYCNKHYHLDNMDFEKLKHELLAKNN